MLCLDDAMELPWLRPVVGAARCAVGATRVPLLHAGSWRQWSISYFGNAIEVGQIINMCLNTSITGFVLFLILRVANRFHRVDV
ncbi:MAG: hypothetical protein ACO21Q_08500 [Burkholderiaceae bacterium]